VAPLTQGLRLLGSAVSYVLACAEPATTQLLSRPTPCAGWDLGLLLDHVSDSAGVLHEAITGGCVGLGPMPGDDWPRRDPVSGFRRRAAVLLATCATGGPGDHPVVIGDRELTASMAAVAGALEVTVHGWDISVACGRCRPVPPGLAAVLLPIATLLITPDTRAGLFADPAPVPGRACPGDQLVAFLGRQPRLPAAAGAA
jgi:uncharacterized protein (TIGR03086 family)